MSARASRILVASLLIHVFMCLLGFAQISSVTGDQAPPIEGVGNDYIKTFNETVNPATGSVSVRISTPVPPSRGFTVPFTFGYDSNAALHRIPQEGWGDNSGTYMAEGGWSYIVPNITGHVNLITYPDSGQAPYQCHFMTGFIFTDDNGGTHAPPLAPTESGGTGNCVYLTGIPYWDPSPNYQSAMDAKIQAVTGFMHLGVPAPITLSDADGKVYYFPTMTDYGISTNSAALPSYIEDRNGNKVVFTDHQKGVFSITDTSGRTSVSSSGFGTTGNTVTISGLGTPYTVTWGSQAPSALPTGSKATTLHTASGYGPCPVSGNVLPNKQITQIALPESGVSYQFSYDSRSSLIKQITYPNGAYIRYDWEIWPLTDFDLTSASYGDYTGEPDCEEQYDSYLLTHRYVSFDGTNQVLQQDFSYYTDWVQCPNTNAVCEDNNQIAWDYKQTTVTTTVRTVVTGQLQT